MMTLIFLLTVSSSYAFFTTFRPAEAGNVWFNDLWLKRQKIVITNSIVNNRIDGFVAEASLPTNVLINQGFMKNNCSDIRVVDSNLNILNYWVDPESCQTATTKIFFQVPLLFDADDENLGQNVFYIYYHNPNADFSTVAVSSLFVSTIPNLKANYSFESVVENIVHDNSGLGNHGRLVNTVISNPGGGVINNNTTFPEGYRKNAYFFNGHNVYLSTPIKMIDLSNAYSMIATVKPEGTRANGYMIRGESMGKIFTFENINKTGTTCDAAEYQEGDGVGSCLTNGLLYVPDLVTQKRAGAYTYYYDFYWNKITRPSLSVTFNGTSQYLYQNNPVNFLPLLTQYNDFGFFYKIKPEGEVGDVRTIHSWGNTAPGNYSYSLDYNVCPDGSLRFILDYNNSTDNSKTLATPCLNSVSPSTKISSNAGKYAIYANSNTWLNLATAQFENKRHILVNGQIVASDNTPNVTISRSSPIFLGKASNSSKSSYKGEIDDYNGFGNDLSWFRGAYYTSGILNTSINQLGANINKKSYVIFGNSDDDFFQAGFSNHASLRYNTATAISNFNYNFNTSDNNDFYQQYGGNYDNTLRAKSSFISGTFDLFNGSWFNYATQFDNASNNISSRFVNGASTYSYNNSYTNVNTNGSLNIGAFVNENPGTSTFASEFFFGGMDEVFVYSQTLSTTQLNLHSAPWNGYTSFGKTLWQSPLTTQQVSALSSSQDFPEESQVLGWYSRDFPFRNRVNIDSLPLLTIPNFQVSFNFDTSTPISSQKMNSDCSGVVIVDDFYRLLPFWIENCNSTTSKFFVKMNPDSIGTDRYSIKGGSNQNILIYYGNKKSTAGTYPPSEVFDTVIPNLNSAYSFDITSGNVAPDLSGIGSGKSLVIDGFGSNQFSQAGAFGNSIYFTGFDNNWASFPFDGSGALNCPDCTGVTFLGWTRLDNTSPGRYVFATSDNGLKYIANYFSIADPTNIFSKISFEVETAQRQVPNEIEKYFFNGFKLDFTSCTNSVFVNRSIVTASSCETNFWNTINAMYLGSNTNDSFRLKGNIDEFRYFNRALTNTEILAYTTNTTIGSSRLDTTINTCNQTNTYCVRSFVTPSYPGSDLLGKYNSKVTYSVQSEEAFASPIIYLKFNENKSLYIGDSSGRISDSWLGGNRNSSIQNGKEPLWAPEEKCIENSCLYFDGLNDIVDISTIPGGQADTYLTNDSNYTYSFWVKPLSNPNSRHTLISFGDDTGREGYTLNLDSNMRLYSYATNAGIYLNYSNGTLPINKWSHVSFVFDSSIKQNQFFINGVLDSTSTNPATCYTSSLCNPTELKRIFLGGNASLVGVSDDYFRGYIDEFKIYKNNLNSSEINLDYAKGLNTLKYQTSVDSDSVVNFNLNAYYTFDEFDRNVAFDYSDIRAEASYPSASNVNVAGIFNNAYSSPGTGTGTVNIPNSNFVNLNSQVTFSLWARILGTTSDERYLIHKSGTGGFNITYNAGTQKYSGEICGTTVTTESTFPNGAWDNIVLTSNSKKVKLFVNSTLQDEEFCFNNYTSSKNNSSVIRVGGNGSSGGSINALIDDLRIYDNYFSNQQVKIMYGYKPKYFSYGNNVTAFYKLDESDGTSSASDSSGNSNNLSMLLPATNQNSWTSFGKIGSSYNFQTNAASTKNILSSASSTLTTGLTRPYSIMGWVAFSEPFYGNYSSTDYPAAVYIGPAINTNNLFSFINIEPQTNLFLNLKMFESNSLIESAKIQFSSPYLYLTIGSKNPVWYHVAGTYNGNERKLFVNGELVAVDTGSSNTFSIGGSAIVLGGMSGNWAIDKYQYQGLLDEVKIYNYARTQEQIIMDMRNSGTSPALNSTVYSNIRTNQKPSSFLTSTESSKYPIIDLSFDSYFSTTDILQSNGPVTLEEITLTNVPVNIKDFQYQFTLPFTGYISSRFSDPDCSNLILTDSLGRRVDYWAEPNSCKNGRASIVLKFPTTNQTEFIKVQLDPAKTTGGSYRNYLSNVNEIFDKVIPNLHIAYNFELLTDTFEDLSGNFKDLFPSSEVNNNFTTPSGAYGKAFNLDGSEVVGSVTLDDGFIRNSWDGITALMWVRPEGLNVTQNRNIFTHEYQVSTNQRFLMYSAQGSGSYNLRTQIYGPSDLLTNGPYSSNNFNLTGISWKFGAGNNIKSFFNSSITSLPNGTNYQSYPNTGTNFYIGVFCCDAPLFSNYFSGPIDEFRLFSKQLSDDEIKAYTANSTSIGTSFQDPANSCNQPNSWCAKSYVTPSFPRTELLGKYNSLITASLNTKNEAVFSAANNGAVYVRDTGVNGSSAYLWTPSLEKSIDLFSPRLSFTTGKDMAISFYINPTNTTSGSIASSTGLKINKLNGNQVNFSGPDFNITSSQTIPANSWSHIVFQKNGQTGVYEVLINKTLQGAVYSASNNLDLTDFKFAHSEGSPFYLDEIKIYDTILNIQEIENLTNLSFAVKFGREDSSYCVNGSSASCSAPSREYLFDEVSGLTAVDSSNISNLQIGQATIRDLGHTRRGLRFENLDTQTFATNFINATGEGSFSFWYKSGKQYDLFEGKGMRIISQTDAKGIDFNGIRNFGAYTGSDWEDIFGFEDRDPWHHILVNYDNSVTPSTFELFFDGVRMIDTTFTKNTTTEHWMQSEGNLDTLRIYTYQRDQAQVSQEYARGKPFAHFKFDECSGNSAYNSNQHLYLPLKLRENGSRTDATGFLNTGLNLTRATGVLNFGTCTGSEVGGPKNIGQEGRFNNGYFFDGNLTLEGNDYHSRVFNSEGNATITFWINKEVDLNQEADIIGTANNTGGHRVQLSGEDIIVYAGSTEKLSTVTKKLKGNGWNHVAVVFENGSNYKIYINGSLEASANGTFESILNTCTGGRPVVCTNRPFVVGKNFNGKLDELKIYNYPLTLEQIKIDMNQDSAIRIN